MTREIPLSRGLVALVDDDDYNTVIVAGKWHATPSRARFYARRNITNEHGQRRGLLLHTFLMGTLGVDHINGDGLDCRRSNMRPASTAQNNRNVGRRADNTSGYKGVQYRGPGRWRARIQIDGKQHHFGLHPTAEDAARAYNAAALQLFGEFAHLNEVP